MEAYENYYARIINSLTEKGIDPNAKYNKGKNFLKSLTRQDYIALRLGKLKVQKINSDGEPNLVQKQVDMLMGLDISQVSYMRIVDRILIFCKDTDMKPALKVARINAVQTVLCNLQEGFDINDDLKRHSDIIRNRSLISIVQELQAAKNKTSVKAI